MFVIDVPPVPVQLAPIVFAQAATSSAPSSVLPDYVLNVCQETPSTGDPKSAMRGVDPVGSLAVELGNRRNRDLLSSPSLNLVKLSMLQGTAHGKLIPHTAGSGRLYYMYEPEHEYIGNDRAEFMADFEGKSYKIVVSLIVSMYVDENSPQCPPSNELIKVKSNSVKNG